MGIERRVVSGIGFEFTEDIKEKYFIDFCDEYGWLDDELLFEKTGLIYNHTAEYDCEVQKWLLVKIHTCDTWQEIDNKIFEFLEKLFEFGINKTKKDLVFISEIYEY